MRIYSCLDENSIVLNNYLTRKEQLILLFVAGAAVLGGIVLYVRRGDPELETQHAAPVVEAAPPPLPAPEPPTPAPTQMLLPVFETPTPSLPAQSGPLRVAVRGAVHAPGLYTFQPDEDPRVQDLLDAAGGLEEYADLSDINVAGRLIDGSTLTVPGQPPQVDARGVIRAARVPVYQPPNPPQYTVSGWMPEAAPPGNVPDDSGTGDALPLAPATDGLLDLNTATQAQLESLPGIGPVFASRIIEYRTRTPFRNVDDLKNIKGIGDKRLADVRHLVTVR